MVKRVLSAIVMAVIFIPFLILGGKAFTALMCVLGCVAMYELLAIKDSKNELPFIIKLFTYFIVMFMVLNNMESMDFNYQLDYKFMSVVIFLFASPLVFIGDNDTYNFSDCLYLIAITLFIGFGFNLIAITRNYDLYHFIYILLIAIMTDIFAYVTGSLVGRHKLCPKISPNKTIEGAIGGTIMGVFVAGSFYHIFINPNYPLILLGIITLIFSFVGQVGDLVFSMIKRYYKTKDFSNLIPGHGGVLDRMDSIIFVVLTYILFINIL